MLQRIEIENFLGLPLFQMTFADMNVIAGPNGSGKSSLRDAIAFAITGDPARVSMKKDYGRLLHNGKKSGRIKAITKVGTYERTLPDGKGAVNDDLVLPYLMDMHLFANQPIAGMREVLMSAIGPGSHPEQIMPMLKARWVNMDFAEQISPLLLSGFGTAEDEAKNQAREAKGAWREVTGCNWSPRIGAEWRPTFQEGEQKDIEALREREAVLLEEIDSTLGYAKLARQRVNRECPHCHGHLVIAAGVPYAPDIAPPAGSQNTEAENLLEQVRKMRDELDRIREDIRLAELHATEGNAIELRQARANQLHQEITDWLALAGALSTDGVQADLLAAGIDDFNSTLQAASRASGWPAAQLDVDQGILYGGRLYDLCSESERWRADAMICVALAQLSDIGMVVLDRLDVLDLPSRAQALKWLYGVRKTCQSIVLATLKEPMPARDGIYTCWLGYREKDAAA